MYNGLALPLRPRLHLVEVSKNHETPRMEEQQHDEGDYSMMPLHNSANAWSMHSTNGHHDENGHDDEEGMDAQYQQLMDSDDDDGKTPQDTTFRYNFGSLASPQDRGYSLLYESNGMLSSDEDETEEIGIRLLPAIFFSSLYYLMQSAVLFN